MALSIQEIRARSVRDTFIEILGDKLNFVFTPAAFTPELEEITLDKEGELKLNTPNILAMLATLLVSWDLTVDPPKCVVDKKTKKERAYDAALDGPLPMLPLELGLRVLPKEYLMAILNKIVEVLNPNETTEESLKSTSDTEVE